ANQRSQPLEVVGPEGLRRSTPVRLGRQRACGAAALEQADDEGGADAEDAGDPADRTLRAIDRGGDPLTEIQRKGTHGGNLHPRLRTSSPCPLSNYSCVQPGGKPL